MQMKNPDRAHRYTHPYDRRLFFRKLTPALTGACLMVPIAPAILQAQEKRMMQGDLSQWKTIRGLEGLEEAFQFLEKAETKSLPEGKHLLQGEDMFASVAFPTTQPAEERKYEAHKKYIDVQFLYSGTEAIRVTPIQGLTVATPFDVQKDIVFYEHNRNFETVVLRPGRFAVFFPEDAHMPLCQQEGIQKLHKVVVKISVDYYRGKLAKK